MSSRTSWHAAICVALTTAVLSSSGFTNGSTAHAEPLLYEGQLDGEPEVLEAIELVAFALYDAAEGGELVWQGAATGLNLSEEGEFTAWIGEGEIGPLSAEHFGGPRWLEVQVDGASLSERQRIGAVPVALLSATSAVEAHGEPPRVEDSRRGLSPHRPATSCSDALESGIERSGVVWVVPPLPPREPPLAGVGEPREVYCDQVTRGGGWALIHNSVMGVDTTRFWRIPYDERLGRFGRASLDSNFYDGMLYLAGHGDDAPNEYLDVVEDVRGKSVVAVHAEAHAFLEGLMAFERPALLDGERRLFNSHINGGWSSADRDHDQGEDVNCSRRYQDVTQHYSNCWRMNLGADADNDHADGMVGPHMSSGIARDLGLMTDDTGYTRLRRLSRFVRW